MKNNIKKIRSDDGVILKISLKMRIIAAVILVFVCLSGLGTLLTVNSRVKKEYIAKSELVEKIFCSAFEQFDDILKTGSDMVEKNNVVLRSDFSELNINEQIEVINQVNTLKARAPYIQEIVIFKKTSDWYITSQGIVNNKDFFNRDYFNEEINIEVLNGIFYDYNFDTVFPLREYIQKDIIGETDNRSLFIIPKIYNIIDVGILILVNEKEFVDFYFSENYDKHFNVSLYNKDGELVISNHSEFAEKKIDVSHIGNSPEKSKFGIFGSFAVLKWFEYGNMVYKMDSYSRVPVIIIIGYLLLLTALVFLLYLIGKRATAVLFVMKPVFSGMGLNETSDFEELKISAQNMEKQLSMADENKSEYKKLKLQNYLSGMTKEIDNRADISEFASNTKFIMVDIIFKGLQEEDIEKKVENLLRSRNISSLSCFVRKHILTVIYGFGYSNDELIRNELYDSIAMVKQLSGENRVIAMYSAVYDNFYYSPNIYKGMNLNLLQIRLNDEFVASERLTEVKNSYIVLPSNVGTEINCFVSTLDKEGIINYVNGIVEKIKSEDSSYENLIFTLRYIYNAFTQSIVQLNKVSEETDRLIKLFLSTFESKTYCFDFQVLVNIIINTIGLIMDEIIASGQKNQIGNIVKYINDNYKSEIYLDNVASRFDMTPKYFSYYFKKELNTGFSEYLTNLRIEEAKRLLLNTKMSIAEIVSEIGYQNNITFNTAFKKKTGMSPSQYRKNSNQ